MGDKEVSDSFPDIGSMFPCFSMVRKTQLRDGVFGGDGDPTFDVDSATVSTSGPVTQTVTATFDTYYIWETFFKAAIEPVHAEEPDPDPDDPEPDPEEEEVE